MPGGYRPTLSVIVPATNSPPTLGACLDAIYCTEEPPEQVIVVEKPPLTGPGQARNNGAAEATSDIVVFVDADVVVHPDVFVRLRDRFVDDPRLAAVFGSYDDRPVVRTSVSTFRNLLHHHVHQASPGPASTFWAGLGAIRRDVFAAIGGFDAVRYPRPSIEDVELGMRLANAGWSIELDPEILGTHLKRWTLRDMVRTDLRQRGIPWVTLLLREGSGSKTLNLGWRHRLSALSCLIAVSALATRRPGTALRPPSRFSRGIATSMHSSRDERARKERPVEWGSTQSTTSPEPRRFSPAFSFTFAVSYSGASRARNEPTAESRLERRLARTGRS